MAVNSGAIPSLAGSGLQADTFLQLIYGEVQRQALLMAFVDDFRLIAIDLFSLDAGGVFDAPSPDTRWERSGALGRSMSIRS